MVNCQSCERTADGTDSSPGFVLHFNDGGAGNRACYFMDIKHD